jgi:hypothetical protein
VRRGGVATGEKKHRVAVLRAADKVAARLYWEKWECQRLGWGNGLNGSRTASLVGRGAIYINSLDLWSYAQGRLRIHEFDGAQTQDEWDTRLGQGGDLYKHVVPGGAWWIRVEQKKIQVSGVEPSPELRAMIEKHEEGFKAWSSGMESDADVKRRRQRNKANMDATICAACGRSLGAEEPIVRVPIWAGKGWGGGSRNVIEVQCFDCWGTDRIDYTASKCLTCGRRVHQRYRPGRRRTFCCTLHQRRYYRRPESAR